MLFQNCLARKIPIFIGSLLLVVALILFFLTRDPYKPIHVVEPDQAPLFHDDYDLDSLIAATKKQIDYLGKLNLQDTIEFGDRSYALSWILISVQEFLAQLITSPTHSEMHSFITENYHIYQAGGRKKKGKRRMLVTGYYEPVFSGSLQKVAPYLTPIYYKPSTLVTKLSKDNKKVVGRLDENGRLIDFWSRAQIENTNLLKGYELAYLKDPFDAYLLHVQGSGRVLLPDNSLLSVRFGGSNGLEYKSIGKLLVDEKILPLKDVSIPAIRDYLEKHPEQLQRVLHHNPRFIFFARGDNLGPRGSSGEVLTPGRSIAVDWGALPGGTIGYLTSKRPDIDADGNITGWTSIKRFVLPQDSGSAIEGTGRVDLYWGSGRYAEIAANHMKEEGTLFFIVKKSAPQQTVIQ